MPWFSSGLVDWPCAHAMSWMSLPRITTPTPSPLMPPALALPGEASVDGQGPRSLLTMRHGPAAYWMLIGAPSRVAVALDSRCRFEIATYSPATPWYEEPGPWMPPRWPAGVT